MSSLGVPGLAGWGRRRTRTAIPARDTAADLRPSALLRRLQRENVLLQRQLSKLMLDNAILKDVARLCRASQPGDGAAPDSLGPAAGGKRL
jgi:hypothetical protein